MTQAGIILPSDEHMLVVRPCFKALCADNKPASKLLSVLCYIYKNSKDQTLDEEGDFYITRTQTQLLESMCDEIDVTTLQRVAIPTLVMFGYIDLIEQVSTKGNIYILHVSHINGALAVYNKNNLQPLTAWLEESIKVQLGKFLIEDLDGINKEKPLSNKENSLLLLGKFLIAIRKISNCRRGRKPRLEVGLEGKIETPKINIDNIKINGKNLRDSASASSHQTRSKTTHSNTLFPIAETPAPEKKPRNTAKAKLARLEQFDLEQPSTIDNIMLLGDCLRGNPLPQVKRADSDYQKALLIGATPLSNRKRKEGGYGYTLDEISRSWLFFKRIAPEGKPWLIADEWWKDKNVDLWVVAKNIDKALAMMEKLEKEHASEQPQQEETCPDDVTPEQQVPDENGCIIWTTNPDYDGFSYRNDWKNFRLMTVDEARAKYKYGKLNLHLAPSDFTDIQWKLVQAGIIVENAYQAAS